MWEVEKVDKTRNIVVRLSDAEFFQIDDVCKRMGLNRSQLIRLALRRFFDLNDVDLVD